MSHDTFIASTIFLNLVKRSSKYKSFWIIFGTSEKISKNSRANSSTLLKAGKYPELVPYT